MREKQDNSAAAVMYARKWALSRNKAYYNFDRLGGDCTNFASQCIFAGSGVMNYTKTFGWYYISLQNRAPAWTGVEYLYNFLVSNKSVGPYGHEVDISEAQPGDIVQLGTNAGDFYHTPFIVAVKPQILVCAHSDNSLNRPLNTYDYDIARFVHIDAVRMM